MNPSQLVALKTAILQSVSLIQGPPGTGKTRTACAILSTLVELKNQRQINGGEKSRGQKLQKIIACAHSNVAADNLLSGLITLNVPTVRLGKPVSVTSSLWNYTLDARLQLESDWIIAKSKLQNIAMNYTDIKTKNMGGENFGAIQRQLGDAKKKFEIIEQKCVSKILHSADVIVCTCIGAGSDIIRSFASKELIRFSTVLVDEAAQCMESATLPTLVMGCERLILIGCARVSVSMFLCIYVCSCSCSYSCIYVCVCVCMYVRMYVCAYVCMCVCMYVRMYVS